MSNKSYGKRANRCEYRDDGLRCQLDQGHDGRHHTSCGEVIREKETEAPEPTITVTEADARVAAMRQAAARTVKTTPFRCHAANDADFHSGCLQTQERSVSAIEKLPANDAALRVIVARARVHEARTWLGMIDADLDPKYPWNKYAAKLEAELAAAEADMKAKP